MSVTVGASRIVFPRIDAGSPDRALLPLQKKLSFDAAVLAPTGDVAEAGRVSIRTEWRNTLAFLVLCDAMCRASQAQQIEVCLKALANNKQYLPSPHSKKSSGQLLQGN